MRSYLLFCLFSIVLFVSNAKRWISSSHKQKSITNDSYVVYWVAGREGLFSTFLQLKTLNFLVTSTGIPRKIFVDDFTAPHYDNGKVRIRMCDYLLMPSHIFCSADPTPMYLRSHESLNVSDSNSVKIHFENDLWRLILPQDVFFRGDPGWWDFSIHKSPAIKSVVAPLTPSLQFQPFVHELAKYMKLIWGITLSEQYPDGEYVAVHWRRGDQLKTRCVRSKGMIDRSINCARVTTFLTHLHDLEKNIQLKYQKKLPILIFTNENNTKILSEIENYGYIVSPHNLLVKISNHSSADSNFQPNLAVAIKNAKSLQQEMVDLVVDSILMFQAVEFHSYGASFLHDVIDSARMLSQKSFCLPNISAHSIGSFCDSFVKQKNIHNTSYHRSLQEYWLKRLPPSKLPAVSPPAPAAISAYKIIKSHHSLKKPNQAHKAPAAK